MRTSRRTRSTALIALVAVLALFGAACRPVRPLGQHDEFSWLYPRGQLDSVTAGDGEVRVVGWAAEHGYISPSFSTPYPSQVVVMVNGNWVPGVFEADRPRPDVAQTLEFLSALGGEETLHEYGRRLRQGPTPSYGFDVTVPAAAGPVTVCVTVINRAVVDGATEIALVGGEVVLGSPVTDHVLLGCESTTVT